jgi:hypothetical protein
VEASSLTPDPGADTDRMTRGGVCSRDESPFLPSCKLRRACCSELVRDTGALMSPWESLQSVEHRDSFSMTSCTPARESQLAHKASMACAHDTTQGAHVTPASLTASTPTARACWMPRRWPRTSCCPAAAAAGPALRHRCLRGVTSRGHSQIIW